MSFDQPQLAASPLIDDLDIDLAEQTASEIAGETVMHGGDLTASGAGTGGELVQTAVDAWGKIDFTHCRPVGPVGHVARVSHRDRPHV